MPHVWPDAVRQRGDVPLGYPGGTFRHQGMLEFIQRQIGGRAGHGPVASAANHAWHRLSAATRNCSETARLQL